MNATINRNTIASTAICIVVVDISEDASPSSSLSEALSPLLALPELPLSAVAPTSTINSIVEELELPDASALVITKL